MTIYGVYDQVADLLAGLDPAKVMALRASPETQARFEVLTEKAEAGELSQREKDELDHFVVLERLVRLAKIRTSSRTNRS